MGLDSDAPRSDLLTVSRLRSFRKCKQREFFEYVEGFRPIDEDENLAFGSLWHAGMDAWWGEIAYARDEFALESALDAIRGKARDAFAQVRAEELLAGYDARWREETVRAFDVRSIEVEFRAGLLNPDTLRTSRTWILGGKVDKCIATRDGNVPGIVEHKTSSDDVSPGSPYWQKLEMDHQVSNYYVGAETFGFRPEFCLYDVVLKPGQKPLKATPPDKRKYKADGTLYANQRENDETPEEYRGRVREAIEAEPERFFVRAEIPRTDAMLKDFLADVWDEGLAMRQVHRRGRAPRNPDACHAYGTCPFWSACSTKTDPAEMPERYQRLAWPHPELTPDEGEPK